MNYDTSVNQKNALIARLLGIYFYYSPKDPIFKRCESALLSIDVLFTYPEQSKKEQTEVLSIFKPLLNNLQKELNNPDLAYQFSVLFEGQGDMKASPWGSVYMDSDHSIFGESTRNYQYFLLQNEIQFTSKLNEPVDQIGLMLMALSLLIEKNDLGSAKQLLSEYLLPWATQYIDLVQSSKISEFYADLSSILDLYLKKLLSELNLTLAVKSIFD